MQKMLQIFSASDLMNQELPAVDYVVPGLITRGLTVLAGKPKVGKSFLMLNLALAVATGGEFLGQRATKGRVLYLALEDNPRRLQERLRNLPNSDEPLELDFATECPAIDQGGFQAIKQWISATENPILVIVDVLARVRPAVVNRQLYQDDYKAGAPLKLLADRFNIAVIAVTHTRKDVALDDRFDAVSATTGLVAVADSAVILGRDNRGTSLYGRGRDLPEFEVALRMDGAGRWELLGDSHVVNQSDVRKAVLRVLATANSPLPPKEIAERAAANYSSLRHILRKMVEAGDLDNDGNGSYSLSVHSDHHGVGGSKSES